MMTALMILQTAVLIVLAVLVAGLLRAYATVLQRLHQLDGGGTAQSNAAPPFRTVNGVVGPSAGRPTDLGPAIGRDEWAAAHDIAGVGLTGEVVAVRTIAVAHDTVLVFLSSGCSGCTGFWEQLGDGRWVASYGGSRLLVVTKGPEDESSSLLAELCPPDVDLIMSSAAWSDYEVPGSPYVVVVDGQTGRVKGEGSGVSLSQVSGLVAQAVGDQAARRAPAAGEPAGRNPFGKPPADVEREHDVDRVLMAAGINPGHASLYAAEPTAPGRTATPSAATHSTAPVGNRG